MTTLDHTVTARRSGNATTDTIAYALQLRRTAGDSHTRFITPSLAALPEIDAALRATVAQLTRRLPAALRTGLVVELGAVEQSIESRAQVKQHRQRRYTCATLDGMVLALGDGWAARADLPWSGITDAAALDDEWPLMLGPSALLAIVTHLVELCMVAGAPLPLPPNLTLRLGCESPYPPHQAPGVSPAWLRPAIWSRPFGALLQDEIPALAIEVAPDVSAPRPALRLDAVAPLSAGKGTIAWTARYSLLVGDGRVLRGVDVLPVRFDAAAIVAAVRGAIATAQPALVGDAVWGESFGLAPMVTTKLLTGSVRS